jgi:hypothetical protein
MMKAARVDADYKAVVSDIPHTMAQQIEYANEFVTLLSTIPETSPMP